MKQSFWAVMVTIGLFILLPLTSNGQLYTESTDASNSVGSPTFGGNISAAGTYTFVGNLAVSDADHISFTTAAGFQVTSVSYSSTVNAGFLTAAVDFLPGGTDINPADLQVPSYFPTSVYSGSSGAGTHKLSTVYSSHGAGATSSPYIWTVIVSAIPNPPTVTTATQSSVSQTSAVLGGNVTANGGATVTERGIVWATTANPTTSNTKVVNGSGNGAFSATVNSLPIATTVYVRAFATNSAGTSYGSQISFTTLAVAVPTLTTATPGSITINSAVLGGAVTYDGGATASPRGIVWSTSTNPTTADNTVPSGGFYTFSDVVTALPSGTLIYVRAYATNSAGTGYGPQVSFTTLSPCTSPTVPTVTYTPSTVCSGGTASLSISGTLNDATAWHIYTGSCGGTQIGTTSTGTFAIPGTLSTSTTYYVRGEGGCPTPGLCGTVTINPTAGDDASFSYSSTQVCSSGSDPTATVTGLSGGTFSSTPSGLSLNTSNGTIDASASTAGSYTVTYTTNGTCPNSSIVSVELGACTPATLVAGDIAFIGYNTDSPDGFTWIALKDIPAGETIYFTEEGWSLADGTWSGTIEGHLTYTVPAGGLSCGDIVKIEETSSNTFTVTGGGTATLSSGSGWSLLGGDQVLAYQSNFPEPATTPTFISGVHGDDGADLGLDGTTFWNLLPYSSVASQLPPGLTNGVNCVSLFPSIGTEVDNAKYTGTLTGDAATLRASINTYTNWTSDNSTPLAIAPSDYSPTVTCPAPCTDPTVPTVTVSAAGSCPGGNRTLTISGTLNDATAWHVYTSSCGGTSVGSTATGSFTVSPTSNTTYYVRGEGGCVTPGSCGSVSVTVPADNTAPTAVCQNVTVQLDASGNGSISTSDVNNGSSDACGIASMSLSKTSFSCSDIGANTVTLTVADASGNTGTCTATVTVQDNVAPTAICQDVTVQLDASGNGSTSTSDVNNGSSDNCSIAGMSLSNSAFTCSNVGANTVTLTVTDVNGNASTCSATVTVQDNIAPTAICQNVTVQLDASGNASISASDIDNGSNDNCGQVTLSLDKSSLNCSDVTQFSSPTAMVDQSQTWGGDASFDVWQSFTATSNRQLSSIDVHIGNPANNTSSVDVYLELYSGEGTGGTLISTASNSIALPQTNPKLFGYEKFNFADVDVQSGQVYTFRVYASASDGGSFIGVSNADPYSGGRASLGGTGQTNFDYIFRVNTVVRAGTTVALTAQDANGNSSICTAKVIVLDNIAPAAICQDVTVQLDASGNASISTSDVNNGSSDACGIASMSLSNTSFACSDVGSNTVTLTVTDVNGNSSTCTSTVTVRDNIAPTALCQDVTVQLDASGNGSISTSDINNGSSDNCSIASISLSNTSFDCSDVGANTVTLTVTDVNGNSSTCTSTVTVQDNVAPTAICQNITVQLDASGAASIATSDVDNGSSDICGIAGISLSNTSFDCDDVDGIPGANFEMVNVPTGNSATIGTTRWQSFTATSNSVLRSVEVFHSNPQAAAVSSSVSMEIYIGEGIGGTLLGTTTSSVVVAPSAPEQYFEYEFNNLPLQSGQVYTYHITTATSTRAWLELNTSNAYTEGRGDGDPSWDYEFRLTAANIVLPSVTLTVTDVNGNSSTCTATVTVEDNVAPVAICQDLTVQLDASGAASISTSDVNSGSSDACGIASMSLSNTSFACNAVGANTVTLTVTDVNGNSSTCTSTVTVQDNIDPTAICQDVTVQLDASGNGSITTADVDNGSSDACGIANISLSKTSFDCSEVGANTVTLTVTDNNGNVSTCTSTISVEDNIAPTTICQDFQVVLPFNGSYTLSVDDIDNGSSDACGIATGVISQSSFTDAHLGNNVITLTVTDNNGNVSTCTSNLMLIASPPTAVCKNAVVYLDALGQYTLLPGTVNDGSSSPYGAPLISSVTPSSFNCSSTTAPNTVTLTVMDVYGQTDACTATVTVMDTISPVALCQNKTLQLDATGNAVLVVGDINNGSSDACGIASMSLSKTSFTCADIGANTVILTVIDIWGNVSTCSAVVTVEDNVAPVATCQNVTVQLDASGAASITTADVNNGSSDACGVAGISLSQTSFGCAEVGANSVTMTVTDNHGNVSTCVAMVTVEDNIAPQALCQDVTLQLDASGMATITASMIDVGSSDNCSVASVTVSPSSFNCSNIGAQPGWITTGASGISAGSADYQSIAAAPNGKLYVAYRDNVNGGKLTVLEWDGASWTPVGGAGVTQGSILFPSMSVAPDGTPYVAFSDNANAGKTTVLRWDGISWNSLGGAGISGSGAWYQSLAISPNGTPYVSYKDFGNGGRATVLSWNGVSWATVGTSGISQGNADFGSLAIGPNDHPYLAYRDNVNGLKLTVLAWDGLAWVALGGVGVSQGSVSYPSISVSPNGTPFVAYQDQANGSKTTVLSWDGSFWTSVGGSGISQGSTEYSSLKAVSSNALYVAYRDNANNGMATVLKWNGASWTPIGGAGVSQGGTLYNSLGIFPDGTPVLAYYDQANGNKTTVIEYDAGNEVVLTVIDDNGNTSTCTATVTVEDNVSPVLVCKPMTYSLSGSSVTIDVNDLVQTASDNCGIASLTTNLNTFDCTQLGTYSVQVTATDVNGNTSQCFSSVTIVDNGIPSVVCQNVQVILDATGNATITTAMIDNGSVASCGGNLTLGLSQTQFTCQDIGANTVTLTGTGSNGNSASCTATVTVVDQTAPTVLCQNVTLQLDANGQASITTADVDNGSSDLCGPVVLSLSKTSFDCSDVGTSQVTLTGTDGSGNTSSCVATITVVDGIAPTITCTSPTVTLNANGSVSISASQLATATDNCGTVSISASQTTFTCSDVGTVNVVLTATDASGNSSSCTSTVTVTDNSSPNLTCQDVTLNLDANGQATLTLSDVVVSSGAICNVVSTTLSQTSFDCSNVGANTVTVTLVASNGQTQTCTSTVTVVDNMAPTVVCQAANIYLDAAGLPVLTVTDLGLIFSDNCGVTDINYDISNIDCDNVGVQNLNIILSDAAGNSTTCVSQVTVIDTISPTIQCQDVTLSLDASGQAALTVSDALVSGSDNCSGTTYALSQTSFDCSHIGIQQVSLTATDANGNTRVCSFIVTVQDEIAPSLTCQNATYSIGTSGQVSVVQGDIVSSVLDNCGTGVSVSFSPASFDCSNIGANNVIVTATDASGNSTTCTAVVTVVDQTAPTISCAANIVVNNDPGQCGAVVSFAAPTATDGCSAVTLVRTDNNQSLVSGSLFPVGTTTVSYKAQDASGNASSCSFTVTVMDAEAPVITCPADISTPSAFGQTSVVVNYTMPSFTDNCSGAVMTQTAGIASGNVFPVGITTNSFTVTDVAGNSAVCSFDVIVSNPWAPQANCPSDIVVNSDPGLCTGAATFTDPQVLNGGSFINVVRIDNTGLNSGDPFPIGTTIIQWEISKQGTTGSANSSFCSMNITVVDNENPVLSCPANLTVSSDPGQCGAVVNYTVPTVTDNCAGATASLFNGPASGSTFPVGTTVVTYQAVDASGNTAQCTFTVTVEDNEAPAITCPADVVVSTTGGSCAATVNYALPTATDNCPGAISLQRTAGNNSGATFQVGVTTVTYEATDAAGNVSSCSFTVTVNSALSVDLGADIIQCTAATIVPSAPSGATYSWNTGATTPTLNVTQSGTYTVTLTWPGGCTATDNINVTITGLPVVSFSGLPTPSFYCLDLPALPLTGSPAGGTFSGPGISGNSFDPGLSGSGTFTIYYTYTDVNGCSASSTQQITVLPCPPVGLEEDPEMEVSLYPNPTGSSATIYWELPSPSDVNIRVVNSLGQVVYTAQHDAQQTTEHELDVRQWASGTYYVLIEYNDGVAQKRLVIQR